MELEPRPASHMEGQLGGPLSWVWWSFWGYPGWEKSVSQVVESQIWHPPAGSVALLGEGSEKGQWSLPAFLSGRKLSPSSRLDARYFSSSLYATGALQAATPVLELRGSKSE